MGQIAPLYKVGFDLLPRREQFDEIRHILSLKGFCYRTRLETEARAAETLFIPSIDRGIPMSFPDAAFAGFIRPRRLVH
jgi:hypothetical protein